MTVEQKVEEEVNKKMLTHNDRRTQTPLKKDNFQGRPPISYTKSKSQKDYPITENKASTKNDTGLGLKLQLDNMEPQLIYETRLETESELFDMHEQDKKDHADVLSAYVLEFTNQQLALQIEDTLRRSELRDNILLNPNSDTGKWINFLAGNKCLKLRRNTAMMVNYERDLIIYGYHVHTVKDEFDYEAVQIKARAWVESLLSTVTSWDRNDQHKAETMMVTKDFVQIYE